MLLIKHRRKRHLQSECEESDLDESEVEAHEVVCLEQGNVEVDEGQREVNTYSSDEKTSQYSDASDSDSDRYDEQYQHVDIRYEEQRAILAKYTTDELSGKGNVDAAELQTRHVEAKKKLSSSWSAIIDKYSRYGLESQGDTVDLMNMSIVEDVGHLKGLNTRLQDVWDPYTDEDEEQGQADPSRDPISLLMERSPPKKYKRSPQRLSEQPAMPNTQLEVSPSTATSPRGCNLEQTAQGQRR